jgi:broad specificity phosphatase PhoE
MQLLMIRHGRPETGISDPKLSETGRTQAATLGMFLERAGIDAILASPLRRAVETAEPTAKALGLDIRLVDGLAEADRFGAHYRSIEELRRSPQEWAKFLADPIGFLGGNAATFKRDVVGAIDLALASGGDGKVALFTHGLPINVVLSHALGLHKITHFVPHYCSITRIGGNSSDDLTVISVNETTFLEQAAR